MPTDRRDPARSLLPLLLAAALAGSACASAPAAVRPDRAPEQSMPAAEPALYPSTYRPLPSVPTVIRGATVLTAAGDRIAGGAVLMRDGRIAAVGREVEVPPGARVVDAAGKWVTPGIIDAHSHLGVYPAPAVRGQQDGNESTDPVTADVWAEHSVWPQDPQFPLALAGGVTTLQTLPGSANLIGGRGVTLRNVPGRTVQAMKFPGAPHGLKMACGENPIRVYGGRGRSPATRMGNVAGYRAAFARAAEYRREWQDYREKQGKGGGRGGDDEDEEPPERDVELDTLAGVLAGEILVQIHCYRADEMAIMLDLAREFGFRVAAFHHAVEAYKIADLLAEQDVCSAIWADWWGFKMEAWDGIRENAALLQKAGACVVVHSDSSQGIQRLNQEAAKAMAAGNRAGIPVSHEQAIRWITLNPARAIGVDRETGSLAPGKRADLVVWSGDPFSVYSRAEQVYVDGALVYDRNDPARQPRTDFSLGAAEARP